MKIDLKRFIIYITLVLSVLYFSLKISWAVPLSYQEAQALKDAEQKASTVIDINLPHVEYNATQLRDPFAPEPVEEPQNETKENVTNIILPPTPLPYLDVQGIVWGAELPQAIINNKVVRIGDQIDGVRIVNIGKEGITVFYGGRQQVIAAPAVNMINEQVVNPEGGADEGAY